MRELKVVSLVADIASDLGIAALLEPRYRRVAQLTMADGARTYFRGTTFDLNGAGATEIAKDKGYAAFFLQGLGYPVPEGEAFYTRDWCRRIDSDRDPDAAYMYARSLGWPVVVKPNSKSQGHGVFVVSKRKQFFHAVSRASVEEHVFLVQRPYTGLDHRVVLLDGHVMSAYQRLPLAVLGDGSSTIDELLVARQDSFNAIGRDTTIDVGDRRIDWTLTRQRLSRDTVLSPRRRVEVLAHANLSAGGDAVDVTPTLHPEWADLCRRVAFDMNLRYIGVDILTTTPMSDAPNEFVILEINAAPGLDNYAMSGSSQAADVRRMYAQVLRALELTRSQTAQRDGTRQRGLPRT